jgi:hypothetical protein
MTLPFQLNAAALATPDLIRGSGQRGTLYKSARIARRKTRVNALAILA